MTSRIGYRRRRRYMSAVSAAAITLVLAVPTAASAQNAAVTADADSPYYRGKQITLMIGHEAGGTYDLYGKLVARRIGAYIAGQPSVIPKSMPAAGGFKSASYLYNQATRDGTFIGTIGQNVAIAQAFNDPHVQYDARKFFWVGRLASSVDVSIAGPRSNVRTIEDLKQYELTVGATAIQAASGLNPLVLNRMIGTRFKIVSGYQGMKGVQLALERGEIDGGYLTAAVLVNEKPEWIAEGKVAVLVQYSVRRSHDFPDVPTMAELGTNEDDRKILALLASGAEIGRSIISTPEIPTAAADALRAGFQAMVTDKAFVTEIAARKLEFEPMTGDDLQKMVEATLDMPKAITERAAQIAAPPGEAR